MTERQVRDESMTLFVAGHETTALSLAWTWYLLGENPAAEARLTRTPAPLSSQCGRRVLRPREKLLPRTVIHESSPISPPAYMMARMNLEPIHLGGCKFPPRSFSASPMGDAS